MIRLDLIIAQRLGVSREEARDIILCGQVLVDGIAYTKPGRKLGDSGAIEILSENGHVDGVREYVSRGGYKLAAAFSAFKIDVNGLVCLDVGASTGGFTDCLLKNGAAKVYAVENGSNQLVPGLLDNPRVVSLENTDIRNVEPDWFAEIIKFAVVDVSFISLTRVLEPICRVLALDAALVCLIKPQFEVGQKFLNKRGIVRDVNACNRAVQNILDFAGAVGLKSIGVVPVPPSGLKGQVPLKDKNQEYLAYFLRKNT